MAQQVQGDDVRGIDSMRCRAAVVVVLLGCLCGTVPHAVAAQPLTPDWRTLGITTGSAIKAKFAGAEGYGISLGGALRPLPAWPGMVRLHRWSWRPALTLIGLIDDSRENGVQMVAFGAEVERHFPVLDGWLQPFVMLGFAPTVLSDAALGERVIGGEFHFTSAVMAGVTVLRPGGVRLAYRLQHTSNGGTHSENPGVDLSGVVLEIPFQRY